MEDTITVQKSKLVQIVVTIILVAFAFSAGYFVGGSGKDKATGQVAALDGGGQEAAAPVQVSAGNGPFLGSADAPVTIIEFSDFECPFCARFVEQAMPQIKSDYIDTGKARLVFRDFPLGMHEQAMPAALAAACAAEQNKFWEYHDKIFQNQASLGTASYKSWAAELGLNAAQFNSCMDSNKYAADVQKDVQDGSRAGVTGTPTFFVGNDKTGYQKIVGAQPYSAFKIAIDDALAR